MTTPYNKKTPPAAAAAGSEGMMMFTKKRRQCPFTAAGIKEIDYKDINTLCQFITERGKIIPRRISGVSFFHQKLLCQAIKRARHMALLPFVTED
jgi:small subunit ribosomal protein S18